MTTERIVIEFATEGIPKTRSEIDSIQENTSKGVQATLDLISGVEIAMSALQGVAGGLYSALIDSNEKLNAELLKSQTNLASNLKLFRDGEEITDITDSITASQELLRKSLKQIEVDTKDLVGVTTQEVNGVFQVLLQNSAAFIGQSKEFANPIEAATASTKNWAAALGTLGLPLEQANQEIRSILQGDVNNPDSTIAKTLQISREQYDQWKANGELIDQLNKKLSVFTAGNALAANSVAGITSNMKSLVEDTAQRLGQPLLEPLVESLRGVYTLMNDNIALFEELAGANIDQIVDIMATLEDTVQEVAEAFNFDPEGAIVSTTESMGKLLGLVDKLISLGGSFISLFGESFSRELQRTVGIINLSAEGLTHLASLLTRVLEASKQYIDLLPNLNIDLDVSGAQSALARLTGGYEDSIEAVETYTGLTDVLLAQTDKLANATNVTADQVAAQITQLQSQKKELQELTAFREEDKKSIESQIAALDKAISSLGEMATATGELEFKSKDLNDLGSTYEVLAQKAEAAQNVINNQGFGSGEQFSEAIEVLTDLTERQVEYGQITIDQARERLGAVSKNSKAEVELRIAALDTLKALEKDFTEFKTQQLELQIQKNQELAETGEISQQDNLEAELEIRTAIANERLAQIDREIAQTKELNLSTERLEAERLQLLQDTADKERGLKSDIYEELASQVERAYDQALAITSQAEADRLQAITTARINQVASEQQYNDELEAMTRARLEAELAAELENISKLEGLASSATTVDNQIAAQEALDEARRNSQSLTQELLELDLSAIEQREEAELASIDARDAKIQESYDQRAQELAQLGLDQEEYNARVAELEVQRIKEVIEAEKAAQAEISGKEARLESENKVRELTLELIDAEIAAEEATQAVIQKQLDLLQEKINKKREYADIDQLEEELKLAEAVRDGVLTHEQAEAQKLDITRERVEKELEILQELAASGTLSGDEELQNQQDILQTKIELAEISTQVADTQRKLSEEAKKTAAETSAVKEAQYEVNRAYGKSVEDYLAGEQTKEQAATQRIKKELEIANKGKDREASMQLEKELAEAILKEKEAQLEAQKRIVSEGYDRQIAKAEEELSILEQKQKLQDFQAQSEARVLELKQSGLNLAQAQLAAVDSGIQTEVSLINEALTTRQRLNEIEKLSGEERKAVAQEETALKQKLNALGETGLLTEKELILERQALQKGELDVKAEQIRISQAQAQLETQNQLAQIELDKIRGQAKARELQVEADILAIKSRQLQAEAKLTQDAAERAALLEQANSLNQASQDLTQLSKAELKAAQQEADIREEILNQQAQAQDIQAQSQLDQLATQEKILDAQQAYERAMNGIKLDVDTSKLDQTIQDIGKVRDTLEEAVRVDNIPIKANIPVTVTPANLDVQVKDNQLSSSIQTLTGDIKGNIRATEGLATAIQRNSNQISELSNSMAKFNTGSAPGSTSGSFRANVTNNITVNVPPGNPEPQVSVESLMDERVTACS